MTAPRIGVLGLQGAIAEHRRALEELGAVTTLVRRPEHLTGLDGLVVPGGESTTISKLAVDLGMLDPVRAVIAAGLPTLGTCAGMIMVAAEVLDGRPDQEQFGGIDMTVRRNAFGRQVDSFEADVEIPVLGPAPFRGVFIRAPWVERIGPDVEVLARLPGDSGSRIVAVRQDSVIATSFHPELTNDHRVHKLLMKMIARA